MDHNAFRKYCKEVMQFVSDYNKTVSKRQILPTVTEGSLRDAMPKAVPGKPKSFDEIMKTIKEHILPRVVHWRHPRYFAHFPSGGSYASLLANMLGSIVLGPAFSWAAGPTIAELESTTLDWLGKMLGLPRPFLSFAMDNQDGGGVIQLSASVATITTALAARHATLKQISHANPAVDKRKSLAKLVAYCSSESEGSMQHVAEFCMVRVRVLGVDATHRLRGETLEQAVREDKEKGLVPFYAYASVGSNASCSVDPIHEIGPICEEHGIWLHVDGAYAGSAFICPEFRHFLQGVEFAESFCTDPSMWMLANFDCCTLWVQNRRKFVEAFVIDPAYLQHSYSGNSIDYRHWSLSLSRRFRSLKLWFIIRLYGVEGLQKHIREHVRLAKLFESCVLEDSRFVLVNRVDFGVVCFRYSGCDELNIQIVSAVNKDGKIFLMGNDVGDQFVIRFCVCSENVQDEDIAVAWEAIIDATERVKEKHRKKSHPCV